MNHVKHPDPLDRSETLRLMQNRSNEISPETIVEAVEFAAANSFSLDHLSRLLVMEGGVDLDTLARIIRQTRSTSTTAQRPSAQPEPLFPASDADRHAPQNCDLTAAA